MNARVRAGLKVASAGVNVGAGAHLERRIVITEPELVNALSTEFAQQLVGLVAYCVEVFVLSVSKAEYLSRPSYAYEHALQKRSTNKQAAPGPSYPTPTARPNAPSPFNCCRAAVGCMCVWTA